MSPDEPQHRALSGVWVLVIFVVVFQVLSFVSNAF